MPRNLSEELKAFERDLARVVARFMRLYDRVEKEIRPGVRPPGKPPLLAGEPKPVTVKAQPELPGYE